MISMASMTKRVPAAGVLSDKTPGLFRRHVSKSRYHGFASFSAPKRPSVILEVADTPDVQAKGLMGRENLPECCGMLFVNLTGGAFWMKGCKIPLDIIFLDDNDRITRIYGMKVDNGAKKYYYEDEKTAIEVPYGFCDRHGISVGMKCKWRTW